MATGRLPTRVSGAGPDGGEGDIVDKMFDEVVAAVPEWKARGHQLRGDGGRGGLGYGDIAGEEAVMILYLLAGAQFIPRHSKYMHPLEPYGTSGVRVAINTGK